MPQREERSGTAITLADVARMAGVSAATVSRFLNEPGSIKLKHRDPIEQAIRKLDYVPNAAARALASRSSRMIGGIFPRLDSLLFAMVYETLQKELAQGGYTLVVASSDYDSTMETEQVRNFIANRVDAILLVGTSHSNETMEIIKRSGVPVLLAACWDESYPVPQVGFSNEDAAGAVCDYLLDLGHRDIAMISGGQATNDRAAARVAGVKRSLARRGMTLSPQRIHYCEFNFESGGEGFRHFMGTDNPPTAIICGSDILAAGALFEAQRMGVKVPDEVSLTGFDDTELGRMVHPSLTSLRTPRREVATKTAEVLLACLKEKKPLTSVQLQTELKTRGSSGPPAHREVISNRSEPPQDNHE